MIKATSWVIRLMGTVQSMAVDEPAFCDTSHRGGTRVS